jgi:hypothetical protein
MRRLASIALGILVIAGCGSDDPETPAACLGTAEDYLDALAAAPGEVRLAGDTPISDCLVPGQEAGDLSAVGSATVEAATELNAEARRTPTSDAVVELGYLVGAVQEGASTTGGIHADLVRRLDAAARFNEEGEAFPAAFERRFGEGYAAAQDSG